MKFNKKKLLASMAILLSGAMMLTACGGGSKESKNEKVATQSEIQKKYPSIIKNEGKPIDGTTLKVGIVSDTGFKGVFNGELYQNGLDASIMGPTMNGAFPIKEGYQLILDSKETPIDIHIDEAAKTVDFKINPKFKWSNGDPVTTADIVKTYEIVANQDYIKASQSPRYGAPWYIVEGIQDYNAGKAKTIKGLEVISPSEMKIHLTKMVPGVLWGGCFPYEFVNAKQVANVPMDKIQECDAVRKNPLSYGPYVIKSIVPGEKVIFKANPYYYKGEPKVKTVEMDILPPSQQVAAMQAGKYDIVTGVSGNVFPQVQQLTNMKIATAPALSLSYLGFKVGKWDAAKNEVITNPNAKMNDPKLKEAMGLAINVEEVANKFSNGLAIRAKSPIVNAFGKLQDPNVKGFPYDMEKAKKLLDEGGYKDVNNDGMREDKNGKPMTINFAFMSGGETAQPISQYYMQQWKKVGLNVKLVDGRLLEMNDFYQRIMDDDPKIDMFVGYWNLATDPNPINFYGKHEQFNMERFTTPELQASLEECNSEKAMNAEYRQKAYYNFQEVFQKNPPCIPLTTGTSFTVINNRVKYYDYSATTTWGWNDIELTAKNPIVSN